MIRSRTALTRSGTERRIEGIFVFVGDADWLALPPNRVSANVPIMPVARLRRSDLDLAWFNLPICVTCHLDRLVRCTDLTRLRYARFRPQVNCKLHRKCFLVDLFRLGSGATGTGVGLPRLAIVGGLPSMSVAEISSIRLSGLKRPAFSSARRVTKCPSTRRPTASTGSRLRGS